MKVQNAAILLIEDDENDLLLIESALKKIGNLIPLHTVHNGAEAINYLSGKGEYSDRTRYPFPTTIITDLKMPGTDGFAVLQYLKENPQWAIIPTVVLSASSDLDDVKKAFMLGAAAYHVKPTDLEGLRQQLKIFLDYWKTCEVPQAASSGQQLKTDSRGKLGERFKEEKSQ